MQNRTHSFELRRKLLKVAIPVLAVGLLPAKFASAGITQPKLGSPSLTSAYIAMLNAAWGGYQKSRKGGRRKLSDSQRQMLKTISALQIMLADQLQFVRDEIETLHQRASRIADKNVRASAEKDLRLAHLSISKYQEESGQFSTKYGSSYFISSPVPSALRQIESLQKASSARSAVDVMRESHFFKNT